MQSTWRFCFFSLTLLIIITLCGMQNDEHPDLRCQDSGELCCCLTTATGVFGFGSAYAITSCCTRTLAGYTLPLIGLREPDCCCELIACLVGAEYTSYLVDLLKNRLDAPDHCITYELISHCRHALEKRRQRPEIQETFRMLTPQDNQDNKELNRIHDE